MLETFSRYFLQKSATVRNFYQLTYNPDTSLILRFIVSLRVIWYVEASPLLWGHEMTLAVQIRNATQHDAPVMSSLMLDLSKKFICPTCEPCEQTLLLKSMQLEQVQNHLLTKTYQVAVVQNKQLVGLVGIEACQHLYHLFVAEPFQGLGMARCLWLSIQ